MIQRIEGIIVAQSPIAHFGDEKTGSSPILRSIVHWDPAQGRHVRLPFISGNAIRGMLRRLCMHDFLAAIGYENKSAKLHHALFTGGLLESTDEASGKVDLELRRALRDALPPVGLFGTAIGNQIIDGCLKVDHAIPICAEYAAYLEGIDDPRKQHSIRTFTDSSFATRRDDLHEEREEGEQARQMKVDFETFVPGTAFVHGFVLVHANAAEAACLGRALELWAEQPWVGGKSSSGYGRVTFDYRPELDSAAYVEFCNDAANAEAARAVLDVLADALGGRQVKADGSLL